MEDVYPAIKEKLGRTPNYKELGQAYSLHMTNRDAQVKKPTTVTELIQDYIDSKERFYASGTILKYKRLLDLIGMFVKEGNRDSIEWVNAKWVLKFIDFLCHSVTASKDKMKNITVGMYIKALKAVMSFNDINTFTVGGVMKGIRIVNKTDNEKPYLSLEELDMLWNYKSDKKNYTEVRNLFMFCSLTGCRYNEVVRLKHDNVIEVDGMKILRHTASKNSSTIEIPLCNRALELINTDQEFLLTYIGNSEANRIIHLILKDLGFTDTIMQVSYSGKNRIEKMVPKHDLIHFHSSRRSYCNMLVEGGMNFQEISDLMGIDVATILKWYAGSNKEDRNSKMLKILNK